MGEVTYCEDCDHMDPWSRKGNSRYALCTKFPRMTGAGFVSKDKFDKDSPYNYCNAINLGHCPLWEPIKGEPK